MWALWVLGFLSINDLFTVRQPQTERGLKKSLKKLGESITRRANEGQSHFTGIKIRC